MKYLQTAAGLVRHSQLAAGAALGVTHLFHVARSDDHMTIEILRCFQDQLGVDVGRVAAPLFHLVARRLARHQEIALHFRF